MAETKKITSLFVVTDTENSYEKIGDIDGGLFEEDWLKDYLKQYGPDNLYRAMASMTRQISNMEISILQEKDNKNTPKSNL